MKRLVLVALLVFAPALIAQTPPVNPSTVVFNSADHNTQDMGVPVVTRYIVEVLPQGGTTVAATRDIGKPAAAANGDVTWAQLASFRTSLSAGTYVARIVAEGPGGRAASAASPPFILEPRAPAAPGAVRIQ